MADSVINPPLVYDGTLAIPKASRTKDGYLSKDDFILFSPEGAAVAVNSFNTRTGEVVLLSDDVLAALGYAPINKAGDTMSGQLSLTADPTLPAHATTRNYVDTAIKTSVAAGGIIGSYRVNTSSILPTDPGAGKIGFNTTAQGDATELFIDKLTDNGFDATTVWASIEPGRRIAIQKKGDATSVARYTVLSVTDVMLFMRVTVTPVSSHGFPLSNNTNIAVAISPITDEFLPIYGGTLTGPLTLAGPPLNSLDAVTRAYADSLVGGTGSALLPDEYLLSSFNASGSKLQFSGGMSASSTTLALTSGTHDFAVGQGILIKGAGTIGATLDLVTKITAISGATITLQNAATATVAAVPLNVQHDDTVAVQSAIDYVVAAKGGTIIAEEGFYRINGPFNSIGSLLRFPLVDIQTGDNVSVKIIGSKPLTAPGFFAGVAIYGTIFQTDRVGAALMIAPPWDPTHPVATDGALIRCNHFYPGNYGAYGWEQVNNVTVFLENLTFRTYENPQISCLDFGMAMNIFLRQITIDAAAMYSTASHATATNTYGLRCPRSTSSSTGHTIDIVYIQNYYTGLIISEQAVVIKAYVMRCMVGVQFDFSFLPVFARVVACNCRIGFYWAAQCPVNLGLDIQNSTTDPDPALNLLYDFHDPANAGSGFITYVINVTETHGTAAPIKTGLTRAVFVDLLGFVPMVIPTAADLTAAQQSFPALLEKINRPL